MEGFFFLFSGTTFPIHSSINDGPWNHENFSLWVCLFLCYLSSCGPPKTHPVQLLGQTVEILEFRSHIPGSFSFSNRPSQDMFPILGPLLVYVSSDPFSSCFADYMWFPICGWDFYSKMCHLAVSSASRSHGFLLQRLAETSSVLRSSLHFPFLGHGLPIGHPLWL